VTLILISFHETLLKKFQDPKFMEAVNLFQTNPTAAMERYKNDKETQDAFMQFCGLMGKQRLARLTHRVMLNIFYLSLGIFSGVSHSSQFD
jgi:hypothetical protein